MKLHKDVYFANNKFYQSYIMALLHWLHFSTAWQTGGSWVQCLTQTSKSEFWLVLN